METFPFDWIKKLNTFHIQLKGRQCKLFQPQMGQFTWWTSTVPIKGAQFRVHVLGSKTLFLIN